jgi:hypothetical protein
VSAILATTHKPYKLRKLTVHHSPVHRMLLTTDRASEELVQILQPLVAVLKKASFGAGKSGSGLRAYELTTSEMAKWRSNASFK